MPELNREMLTWLRLMRTFHAIQRREIAFLTERGLSLAQFDVLAHLSGHEGITQQRLADSLLVTKGNVCHLIDRMPAWIERRADPTSRRSNLLYLTPDGKALATTVLSAHDTYLSDLLGGLPDAFYRQMSGGLRAWERSVKRVDISMSEVSVAVGGLK